MSISVFGPDYSLDTTWGRNDNPAVAIPSKKDERLTRCGPAEGGVHNL
jgi:hypothetical protein